MLQTPYLDERALQSYLGRLAVNLEAQVVNSNPDTQEATSGHETIHSSAMSDGQGPHIVIQAPSTDTEHGNNDGHILLVWKKSVFLNRPRLRLQNPSVVFSATANLKPVEQVQDDTLSEEYLPSQIPSGINLLEVSSI